MWRSLPSLLCCGLAAAGATACGDDDEPTILARGEDVEIVGDGIGTQTLNLDAQEADGEATGEFRISEVVVDVECAATPTGGVVVLGGVVTTGDSDDPSMVGERLGLIIREDEPDSVALWGDSDDAGSCEALLDAIPDGHFTDDSLYNDVEAGHDIRTG